LQRQKENEVLVRKAQAERIDEIVSIAVEKARAELEETYRVRELERVSAMEELKRQLLNGGK
jgi:hypothetical protein